MPKTLESPSVENALDKSRAYVHAAISRSISCTSFDAKCDWILFAAELVQQYRSLRRSQMFGELNAEKK